LDVGGRKEDVDLCHVPIRRWSYLSISFPANFGGLNSGPKATPTLMARRSSGVLVLKPHNSLEEAIASRHVVRMDSRKVSNQYWEWCLIHSRPFLAISISTSRSRYAAVEMDLYGLGAGGFDKGGGREVLRTVLSQPLKGGSFFFVSPVYVFAQVAVTAAKTLAISLYHSAKEALSLDQITHEEWMSGKLERAMLGGRQESAFPPISGEASAGAIKILLDDDSLF